MKGFKSTSTNPYTYTQSGVWKKGQYTFQAVVKSDSGYSIAFQKPDLSWDVIDLSWQVQAGQYCSVLEAGFTLEYDAVAFKLIANDVTGEVVVLSPMLEQGGNPSTPIAHEEDLRGMDGDNHEFIFTRNDTGIAPDAPLSTQEDDLEPDGWTDNPQGVTKELPFEFVSMREKKVGVWLDFSPPSLWAKWSEDGLSVYLRKQGHYESHWVGTEKVTDIVGGEMFGETELIKVTAVFHKGEEDVAPTESLSRGFQWYVNGVHLPAFDDQHYITLDNTYGDGFADIVKLSYIVNSLREEIEVEVMNISAGMDGIGEEFIFKANNSNITPPVLPQTTDENYQDDDYHGKGTANVWDDDPVAPTELNQYVWVAKRKKVGGIWEAFGTPSLWTWWVTDGGDAAYWELRSSAPLIYKDAEDASTSGVHTTITLSGRYVEGVTSQNGGYISVQPNGGVEDTPLISPREFTPPNNAGVDEYVFRLYDDASKTTLLDTLTVPIAFKGEKGVSAINITLSNEADALPATEDGVVTDYTGSGTTIRVFEGSQELSYGTGNGQYQVSASGSNISPDSTPTTNGNARVYGNATSMGAAATAVITFVVSGKTFDGESFSFDKVQNFTKSERGASAPLLYLSASAQVMKCNPDNTPQTGQTISIEAKLQNVSGAATFVATPYNDSGTALTAITLGGTGNTRTLTNAQWLATYKRIEVVATLGSLTDKVTIHRLADGATGENVIVGFLTNENITLQANSAGVVSSFTSANGEFWVYDGTTKVTSGITFSKVSQTGCTAAITSAGVYSVSAMSADNATVVLRAVYGGVTIDKVLTLSKSKAGADGDGIVSTTIEYAKSSSGTAIPTTWSTSLPTPTKGWYLWTRTTTVYKTSPTTVAYSISYWSEDGTGILDVVDWYAKSTSGTTAPSTGWQTTLPTKSANEYLWNYEVITYTDGRTPTETQKRVIQGKDARSIYDIKNAYAYSASDTVSPTSGWQYSIAALGTKPAGYFLWVREDIAYTDNPSNYISTIGYVVRDGGKGEDAADIRLTATNTQAVIGTSGVTPTQITVTGTAKNTTISGWSYSVDGGSFTTPPNGVTRAGYVVTINTAVAVWRTLAIKAYNTTDNVDSVITISIVGYGAAGKNGKVPIVKEWLSGDTHLNNDDVVDYIYYRPTQTWWKLKDAYTSRTASSSPSTTYYEQIPYMSALATKVLIAEEANLANFVFKGGKLLSIAGTVNGSPAVYTGQAGFVHNIVLDGESGTIMVRNGEFNGVINALSGFIGDIEIADGGLLSEGESGGFFIAPDGAVHLHDANGAVRTSIRAGVIPSISSYFSQTGDSQTVGLSASSSGLLSSTQYSSSFNVVIGVGGSYKITVPPIAINAGASWSNGSWVSVNNDMIIVDVEVYIEKLSGSTVVWSSLVGSNSAVIALNGGTTTPPKTVTSPTVNTLSRMYTFTSGGTFRLRYYYRLRMQSGGLAPSGTGGSGSASSGTGSFVTFPIINRSEIGNNGMMIATDSNNYTYMVDGIYEVRRGAYGLQITNSGIKKWNGTSWVTANI